MTSHRGGRAKALAVAVITDTGQQPFNGPFGQLHTAGPLRLMPAAVAADSAARGVAVPKDAAMEYMRRHDLKQLFEELSTELVVQQPENPREFVYDLLGRMLELPPRDAAAATQDKTPHGFEKVKMVVENVGSDGELLPLGASALRDRSGGGAQRPAAPPRPLRPDAVARGSARAGTVRTRRCTGTFPVKSAQTRAARLQWEQGAAGAGCVHARARMLGRHGAWPPLRSLRATVLPSCCPLSRPCLTSLRRVAAALHAMVWGAGEGADPAADEIASAEPEGDDDEMEAMRDEIEELREKVEDLEYEAEQIKNAARHHVQEVRNGAKCV